MYKTNLVTPLTRDHFNAKGREEHKKEEETGEKKETAEKNRKEGEESKGKDKKDKKSAAKYSHSFIKRHKDTVSKVIFLKI